MSATDAAKPVTQRAADRTVKAAKKTVSPKGAREERAIDDAFDRLVDEGATRLRRPLLPLLSTGLLGGVDVAFGVFADILVVHETGSALLGALAFTIGFIALLLAGSELFTENFLVPVTAVVGGAGSLRALGRLWVVTLGTNLAGGLLMAWIIVTARPDLRQTAADLGGHYAHLGVNARSFALAVLAGAVITLMTRMQHATDNLGVRIVPAIVMPFLLVGGMLFHSILDSILMFTGLIGGLAHYGYGDWAVALVWSSFGNVVGGVGLVTGIRFLRVPHRIAEEREQNA